MNRNYEIDMFLRRLSSIYKQNPHINVSNDTIYSELRKFNFTNNDYEEIPQTNISNIQNNLDNKYTNDKRAHTFTNGYFWVIENRGNLDYRTDFRSTINNSIKIYVSVDENCISYVSDKIFEFMLNNNIINQSKISKVMRNDALVLRVATIDDARKVTDFINSLQYKSKNKPNPFLYNEGKVSIAVDGTLSFNTTISEIISTYLYSRRMNNLLDIVCFNDFVNFLNYEYRNMNSLGDNEYIGALEQIKNGEFVDKYHYKILAYHILCNNLNGNINSLDFFKDFQNRNILKQMYSKLGINDLEYGEPTEILEKKEFNNINNNSMIESENNYCTLLNCLLKVYDINKIHNIFNNYISTGKLEYFTRTEIDGISIRRFVVQNFSPMNLYETMNRVGFNIFLNTFKNTYNKYGYENVYMAVKKLFINDNYDSFTNDDNCRVLLKISIPLNNLKYIIYEKLTKMNKEYNIDNIVEYLFSEVNKISKLETTSIGL